MISYIFKTNVLKLDAKFVFNKVKNKMKYMQMLLFSFWEKKLMQILKQLEFIHLYVILKASMSILLDPQQEQPKED